MNRPSGNSAIPIDDAWRMWTAILRPLDQKTRLTVNIMDRSAEHFGSSGFVMGYRTAERGACQGAICFAATSAEWIGQMLMAAVHLPRTRGSVVCKRG
jgi:hypothetical protein